MKKQKLNIHHENLFVMVDYMALMSETLTACPKFYEVIEDRPESTLNY